MTSIFVAILVTLLVLLSIQRSSATIYTCDPTSSCGCSSMSTILMRIVGGEAALTDSWGWIVSLYHQNGFYCGGSLIAADLVITAAHCIQRELENLSRITVIAGSIMLSNAHNKGQVRNVVSVYIHPDFDKETNLNDIAIIRLVSPFNMSSSRLTTICLPNIVTNESLAKQEYPEPGTTLVAIGWGQNTFENKSVNPFLQQVTVQAVASNSGKCIQDIINPIVRFCAGVSKGGKDTCQGDSGGPLMAFVSNRWQLMGITSIGYECARADHAGVYTRVPYFVPFIQSILSNSQTIPTAWAIQNPGNDGSGLRMTIKEHMSLIVSTLMMIVLGALLF